MDSMSDAYKCDRCGEFGEGAAPNTIETTNSKDGIQTIGDKFIKEKEYSLCGGCGKEVQKVLEL